MSLRASLEKNRPQYRTTRAHGARHMLTAEPWNLDELSTELSDMAQDGGEVDHRHSGRPVCLCETEHPKWLNRAYTFQGRN